MRRRALGCSKNDDDCFENQSCPSDVELPGGENVTRHYHLPNHHVPGCCLKYAVSAY